MRARAVCVYLKMRTRRISSTCTAPSTPVLPLELFNTIQRRIPHRLHREDAFELHTRVSSTSQLPVLQHFLSNHHHAVINTISTTNKQHTACTEKMYYELHHPVRILNVS
uniref:Uncharacterized protein n=1 Tax=Cacopsylla melanoneura TaxID=428564 RepID=A0A8D8QED8_9HEMI